MCVCVCVCVCLSVCLSVCACVVECMCFGFLFFSTNTQLNAFKDLQVRFIQRRINKSKPETKEFEI